MNFHHVYFFPLLCITIALLLLVKSGVKKRIIVLITSLIFYSYVDLVFSLILAMSLIVSYICSLNIYRHENVYVKKMALLIGILINGISLFIFKYLSFFFENTSILFDDNYSNTVLLNIGLPLGISFYSFRLISYLVDVYKRRLDPPSVIDFSIYGTFFPIMVSGPISRALRFIPQISNITITADKLYRGYRLIAIGFFLKLFIADRIAPYVNFFYDHNEAMDFISAWMAVLAYSVQIYCDFAGYSSTAIGVALMMGLEIEDNFNFPYLAKSISDFWRRWHITLSEWIRDYIYIALGGNRGGALRTIVNISVAMVLCGLWHGAAWTFVMWGGVHALLLIMNRVWRETKASMILSDQYPRIYNVCAWFITYLSVTLSWVFFRSESLKQAKEVILQLFSFSFNGIGWYHPFVLFVLIAFAFFHLLYKSNIRWIVLPIDSKYTPTILLCLIWLSFVFYPTEFQPFVYEKF